MRNTTRNIQLFALHIRLPQGKTDYQETIAAVGSMSAQSRIIDVGKNRLLGISEFVMQGQKARIIAHEGEPGEFPLIFNTLTARDRVGRLKEEEVLAHKTHCIFDAAKRLAVIEYNHKGAKAERIGEALEQLLRRIEKYRGVTVELNPQADESFLAAIERFERVRMASLKIARPNLDWNDHFNNLTAIGADSEGEKIEVVVSAARSASLSKTAGVIQYIKDLAREGLSVLKGARVYGVREGEASATTISLGNFIRHQRVYVRLGAGHQVDRGDIFSKMEEFLDTHQARGSDA
ncbi:MAG: hypothetical protein WC969_08295 [Elusimicrobiota bacterium]|jgi:hypothetical protein